MEICCGKNSQHGQGHPTCYHIYCTFSYDTLAYHAYVVITSYLVYFSAVSDACLQTVHAMVALCNLTLYSHYTTQFIPDVRYCATVINESHV